MDELDKYWAEIQEPIGDDPVSLLHGMERHRGLIARVGQMAVDAEYRLMQKEGEVRSMLRKEMPDAPESRIVNEVAHQCSGEKFALRRCQELQKALHVGFKTLQSALSFAKTEMGFHR